MRHDPEARMQVGEGESSYIIRLRSAQTHPDTHAMQHSPRIVFLHRVQCVFSARLTPLQETQLWSMCRVTASNRELCLLDKTLQRRLVLFRCFVCM